MTTDNRTQIAEETRKVYLEQHNQYLKDDTLFERFLKMVSDPEYFHLKKEDFANKTILDAGCGNSAYFPLAMANMGVGKMTCLDLGDEWIGPLKEALTRFGVEDGRIDYVPGSTTSLPFADESFDIVFSNGVIMHLADMDEIRAAFSELARVTKKGGYLYIILGCPSGLMEEQIAPALRAFYRSNSTFKDLIDTMTPDTIMELFDDISEGMKRHTGEAPEFTRENVRKLFDVDFCTFIQNVTQAPTRFVVQLDEDFASSMFDKHGFEKPLRCKRYVKRQNVRKYLAPLHYASDNRFARLLYGPGNLEYIARKK